MNLSGLSAVYPGYQAEQDRTAKTEVNQTKAREAMIKLLGANVAGAALASAGQPGPQAPPPGQASVPAPKPMPPPMPPPAPPMAAPGAPQAPPPPAAAPPPVAPSVVPPAASAPPPQAAAPAVGGKIPLQVAVAQILKSSPGVANHPEVLLSALTHLNDLELLDPEAAAKIEEANKQQTMQRVGTAKGLAKPAPAQAAATAAPPMPTATNPQTGAKLQWDGEAWQPMS